MTSLAGKTLFITGASRGIGLAIALRAARDGANIVIAAKSGVPNPKLPGTIHTAAAEIEAAGGKALALQVDIREEDQVGNAVAAAVERFGGIDICVNNASAIWLAGIEGTQSPRVDAVSTAVAGPEVVWPAHGLHDRQVRHEPVRAGHVGRVSGCRHCSECAVAQDSNSYGSYRHDRGHPCGKLPETGDRGRCRARHPGQAIAREQRPLLHRR